LSAVIFLYFFLMISFHFHHHKPILHCP
jgi:hypothetical protein